MIPKQVLQKQQDEIIKGSMKRVVRHKTLINKIAKDERLSPHRRLLAELFLIWMDTEGEERKDVFDIIKAQYGSSNRVKWSHPVDPTTPKSIGLIETESIQVLKDFFAKAKEEVEETKQEQQDSEQSEEDEILTT